MFKKFKQQVLLLLALIVFITVVRQIIPRNFVFNENVWTAIKVKNVDMLSRCLQKTDYRNERFNGLTPVMYCVIQDFPEGIEILHVHNYDLNARCNSSSSVTLQPVEWILDLRDWEIWV